MTGFEGFLALIDLVLKGKQVREANDRKEFAEALITLCETLELTQRNAHVVSLAIDGFLDSQDFSTLLTTIRNQDSALIDCQRHWQKVCGVLGYCYELDKEKIYYDMASLKSGMLYELTREAEKALYQSDAANNHQRLIELRDELRSQRYIEQVDQVLERLREYTRTLVPLNELLELSKGREIIWPR